MLRLRVIRILEFDGVDDEYYDSTGNRTKTDPDAFVQIDIGAEVVFHYVIISYISYSHSEIKKAKLYSSIDGTNWTEIYYIERENYTGNGITQERYNIEETNQIPARYFRLDFIENHGNYNTKAISNIALFGDYPLKSLIGVPGTYNVHPTTNGDGIGVELEVIINDNQIIRGLVISEGTGYAVGDELTIEFTDQEIHYYDPIIRLTTNDLRVYRIPISLFYTSGWSAREVLTLGYPITDLKVGGYTTTQLKAEDPSFTILELKTAGYSGREVMEGGYPPTDLKTEYTALNLITNSNFNTTELRNVAYG